MSNDSQSPESGATKVHLDLRERDARFAIDHLRFLVDRETPTTADHAAATLSARWLADQIEQAVESAVRCLRAVEAERGALRERVEALVVESLARPQPGYVSALTLRAALDADRSTDPSAGSERA